jgi:hypothetical protein
MNHRERFCTNIMYLCFTAGAVILMQGTTIANQAHQNPSSVGEPIAHRGSGRVEVATQPQTP